MINVMSSQIAPLKSVQNTSFYNRIENESSPEPYLPQTDVKVRKQAYNPYANRATHRTPDPFAYPPEMIEIKPSKKKKRFKRNIRESIEDSLSHLGFLFDESFRKRNSFYLIFGNFF